MWTETRVSEKLQIRYPIIQGPFGGLSTAKLVSTVSNGGGMGSFGAYLLSPDEIRQTVSEIRSLTNSAFAINLWIPVEGERGRRFTRESYDAGVGLLAPFYEKFGVEAPAYQEFADDVFAKQVEALLDAKPPVFSFIFGVPDREILKECRRRGIITIGTTTHVDEAVAMDEAGVDLIVASGAEAGGHRAAFLGHAIDAPGTLALVPQVVDAVKAPVIAAGGIADGRGIAAAFALGAEAVQVGTAFVVCDESDATAIHRAGLTGPNARYTMLTRAYSGRYARCQTNAFTTYIREHEQDIPDYPFQGQLSSPLRAAAAESGDQTVAAMWSGQSAALIKHTKAADVLSFLVEDANRVFEKLRSY